MVFCLHFAGGLNKYWATSNQFKEALRRRLIFGLRWEHGEAEAFLENYVGNGHGCWLDWPLAAAVFRSRNTLRPERGELSAM